MDKVTTRATRRAFLSTIAASASLGAVRAARRAGTTPANGDTTMYGLIGKMTATPGQRDALIAILLEGTGAMPGCLSYIVAADPADADAIWITEVWDSEASHKASLALPAVQDAITRGRPLIAGFGDRTVTTPIGGVGLPSGR
jgi:quinol monooxygenase YgiN